jgi:putative transposase
LAAVRGKIDAKEQPQQVEEFCKSNPKLVWAELEKMEKREFHPPHIYTDNACYFVTASVVHSQRLFDTTEKRMVLQDVLKAAITQYGVRLYAWVILANHYHLLLRTSDTAPLHKFIKRLHGDSAIRLNKFVATPGRKVWYQYWDRFPRNERDFWAYFNYIHINPLKHGYAQLASVTGGEWSEIVLGQTAEIHQCLACYPHSSYNYYLCEYGEEFLTDAWMRYPVADYFDKDDF